MNLGVGKRTTLLKNFGDSIKANVSYGVLNLSCNAKIIGEKIG